MTPHLSDSDTDLVQAISTCKRRRPNHARLHTTAMPRGLFARQVCRKRRRLLLDIDFVDGRRGGGTGRTRLCSSQDEGRDEEAEEQRRQQEELKVSQGVRVDPLIDIIRKCGGQKHRPKERPGKKSAADSTNCNDDETKKLNAQTEGLLLVLLDLWDGLTPSHRNTLINTYNEHYEARLLEKNQASTNGPIEAESGGACVGHEQVTTATLLPSSIACTRHDLKDQLRQARRHLLPMLDDAQLLAYLSSAERARSWRYVIRVATSLQQSADPTGLKYITSPEKFVDLMLARVALNRHIKKQKELDKSCICKPESTECPTGPDRYKQRPGKKQCHTKKFREDNNPHRFDVYEKRHHDRRYIYWYIDIESTWEPSDGQNQGGFGEKIHSRGDAVNKHSETGLFVVSGYLYTAMRDSRSCPMPNRADGNSGWHDGQHRPTLPSPTMKMSRLPTSVWTKRDCANEAAFALATANTQVDAMTANDLDAWAWQALIRPALCQAWQETQADSDVLFECTMDIPDVLRDRLGYDAIGVEVVWVEPGRAAKQKKRVEAAPGELS
ncbi:hypothetical protein MN608_02127 [Microdochium nivale]|nr:hypothetical protein MN608_02127 [Microdochium nivale]